MTNLRPARLAAALAAALVLAVPASALAAGPTGPGGPPRHHPGASDQKPVRPAGRQGGP